MKKPNIVLILTDDQGPWALHCAGTPELITPNIDALAREGVYCKQFYCTSPVCSPARASLLTGRMPSAHGVFDWLSGGNMAGDSDGNEPVAYLDGCPGYTDLLNQNGYDCALSGKWHLGDSLRPQKGFSYWYAHQYGGGNYYGAPMIENGVPYREERYVTEAITDRAVAYIHSRRDQENPFYLSVHYTAPHSPWRGEQHPKAIRDLYKDCDFASLPRLPLSMASTMWVEPETEEWRQSLIGYFAAITAVDQSVGRLVAALQEIEAKEDTLIVYASDNGFNCGHHGVWGKGNGTWPLNCYEESVRVPMIFHQPGRLPAGRTVEALSSGYDFFPTILALAGLAAPADPRRPGLNLAPLLSGAQNVLHERVVVYDEYGPLRMLRNERWKYVHWLDGRPDQLYDLDNDPGEERDAIADASPALRARLRDGLRDWFQTHSEAKYAEAARYATGGGQKRRATDKDAFAPPYYTKAERLQREEPSPYGESPRR